MQPYETGPAWSPVQTLHHVSSDIPWNGIGGTQRADVKASGQGKPGVFF